ncbi:hypothetical protein STEPF1_00407 [Streptomyces sp. F-1]|nr:hypothetical protein STEPF1_00407 [Streptomyces sp. F-1]
MVVVPVAGGELLGVRLVGAVEVVGEGVDAVPVRHWQVGQGLGLGLGLHRSLLRHRTVVSYQWRHMRGDRRRRRAVTGFCHQSIRRLDHWS